MYKLGSAEAAAVAGSWQEPRPKILSLPGLMPKRHPLHETIVVPKLRPDSLVLSPNAVMILWYTE